MSSNHTITIDIKHGAESEGFFSYEDPDNLIVFVHGFKGSSVETWMNFNSILLSDNDFKKSDIVFYGYQTLKKRASDHAGALYKFLDLMVSPLKNGILPSKQKLNERNYKKIILVAHSLGAILVRQAQLTSYQQGKPWVNQTVLVLFAPAHHGADALTLAMEASKLLPGLFKIVGLISKYRYPILTDLDPAGNGIIQEIKRLTEKLQDEGRGDFTKARIVVHAENDKVIQSHNYLLDNEAERIPNSSHIKVCKPNIKYLHPLTFLKTII